MSRQKCHALTCDRLTNAGLCAIHRTALTQRLDAIPDLLDELLTQVTRQSRYSTGQARSSDSPPLMFNENASTIEHQLRATIRRWDTAVADHLALPVRHPDARMSAAFIRHAHTTGRLDTWPNTGQLLTELDNLHDAIQKTIDAPTEQYELGICSAPIPAGTDDQGHPVTILCTQHLRADNDTGYIECPTCHAQHSIHDRRATLLDNSPDTLITAAEAARAISVLHDYERGVNNLVDRIAKWDTRGRLIPRGTIPIDGRTRKLYRLGDILDLVNETDRSR